MPLQKGQVQNYKSDHLSFLLPEHPPTPICTDLSSNSGGNIKANWSTIPLRIHWNSDPLLVNITRCKTMLDRTHFSTSRYVQYQQSHSAAVSEWGKEKHQIMFVSLKVEKRLILWLLIVKPCDWRLLNNPSLEGLESSPFSSSPSVPFNLFSQKLFLPL